jgi:predicted TIM-barrel fold metal-dependent hydrolase
MDRRDFIRISSQIAFAQALMAGGTTGAGAQTRPLRIATEEACSFPEVTAEMKKVAAQGGDNLDIEIIQAIYNMPWNGPGESTLDRLLDVGAGRIAVMDASGVDMHLLSLSSPGVQMFETDRAVALAALANDQMAEAIAKNPARFAGLAAVAPQDPTRAAQEMERAINRLKLNGFIINSHTNNRYLDEEFFWPILEAAEALDRPIYIHPRSPSDGLAGPFRGLSLPSWGYNTETSTHAVRLIFTGTFDRFPRLKIVLGHMGEGVHFWEARLDRRYSYSSYSKYFVKLALKPSDYLRRNVLITTSGQENHAALDYSIRALGADHVMWAIDYPFERTETAVSFMQAAPIDEADRAMVFGGNAQRVFHIGV